MCSQPSVFQHACFFCWESRIMDELFFLFFPAGQTICYLFFLKLPLLANLVSTYSYRISVSSALDKETVHANLWSSCIWALHCVALSRLAGIAFSIENFAGLEQYYRVSARGSSSHYPPNALTGETCSVTQQPLLAPPLFFPKSSIRNNQAWEVEGQHIKVLENTSTVSCHYQLLKRRLGWAKFTLNVCWVLAS